ncbi:ABC transporter substrate-binding protein [Microbacterium sp. No. 7]|uniref:ABC transporter substrate-binding protein n=1 Tax=Microbacterium sp. No. 7 TaxID=1714373 RepID=UPI0006CFCCB2|nr:ABC transporter substrate-binding protein [Microbacterium sp. No. 7]ALJ20416.1 hypothetical protein AOA12_11075 [Microbacterium sp. No. 7]
MARIHRAAAVLATLALLTGCSAAVGPAPTPTDVKTMLTADPTTFDPARGLAIDDYLIARYLFDSLLRHDDGGITGALAESYEADSASEYRFVIRDDATCADGTPITASIVADSLEYFAAPDTGSTFRVLVFGVGEPTITADDASRTVSISLSEPWSDLPAGLTLAQTGIICPAGLAAPEELAAGTVEAAFSGPYTLADANPGVGYRVELREGYTAWPDYAVPVEGTVPAAVGFALASDPATVANQLRSGDLDIGILADDNLDRFASDDAFELLLTDGVGTWLVFNEREGSVFHDAPELRAAVASAIDRAALNTVVSSGRAELFDSIVSPQIECALDGGDLLHPFDPEAARALEGVRIRLIGSNTIGPAGSGNEYVQSALREAGADVELRNTDPGTWVNNLVDLGWDLTMYGDANQTGTVSASLSRLLWTPAESGGRSVGAADNPEGTELMWQALATSDPAERCDYLERAQRTALERTDVIPLFSGSPTVVVRDGFAAGTYAGYYDPTSIRILP